MKDKNKLTKFDRNKSNVIAVILLIFVFLLPGIITFIISGKIGYSIIVIISFWLLAIIMTT